MVFLIPWVPNMMVWTLFFLGKNLLFKFILTGCGVPCESAIRCATETKDSRPKKFVNLLSTSIDEFT